MLIIMQEVSNYSFTNQQRLASKLAERQNYLHKTMIDKIANSSATIYDISCIQSIIVVTAVTWGRETGSGV